MTRTDRSLHSFYVRNVHPHGLWLLAAVILLVLGVCAIQPVRPASAVQVAPTAIAADTDKAMIALGERVFLGRAGGALCVTCHAANAKGVASLGPDLTDATWLHGDGSASFLRDVIRTGVSKPKKATVPMPPSGGGTLDAAQLAAVAAYVYSLSH